MTMILIKNGYLLTLNHKNDSFRGDLLIENDRISEIAKTINKKADKIIDATNCLVLPGFIQGHIHLPQALFKRMFDNSPDSNNLGEALDRIALYESKHTPETLYASARFGIAEAIKSGTTGVIDMGTLKYQDSIFQAIEESGIRAQAGKAMMDLTENLPPYLRESTEQSLKESVDLLHRWHGKANGRIRYGFAPRWQLWNTDELLREVKKEAEIHNAGIHGHAAEGRDEATLMIHQRGKRNLVFLNDLGVVGPNVVMAHCIWLDETEMRILEDSGTHVTHCPVSNSWGAGIARVPEMITRGINVALGSDGACTGNMNMFHEMKAAHHMHQNRLDDTVSGAQLSPEAILNLAIKGGAAAIGMKEELGSLEENKKADLIILDSGGFDAGPWLDYDHEDPISRIVLWYSSNSVITSIIDGKVVMEDKVLLTMNEGEIHSEANKAILSIYNRLEE